MQCFYRGGLTTVGITLFMLFQKKQQIDNKQKIKKNLPENAFEAVKPYFGPQQCSNAPSSNTDKVLFDPALLKLVNK